MLKSAKPVMTLNQFMVRGQVIKQYRDFLKTAKRLPDENARKVKIFHYFTFWEYFTAIVVVGSNKTKKINIQLNNMRFKLERPNN